MRVKMAQAVQLAKLFDPTRVDWALGHAAVHGRFAEADLASILDRHATTDIGVIKTLQHQVFGYFTGDAVLDDGTRVHLDHFLGFAEKVFNAW